VSNKMDAGQLDNLLRIAEMIDKYGVLVVGMAAFIFIALIAVFFVFNRHKKMTSDKDVDYQKMFTEMHKQNQTVFSQLMQSAFKPNQPELVSEGITATVAVQDQLKQVAAVTKADRVAVYVFHNGQRMMNGRHMIKFSCWAEFTMLSRFVRIDKHKDVQVSRIQDICDALIKERHWEALAEDDVRDSQLCIWNSEDTEIKSAFAKAVYSTEGIIIGFVLIEYLLDPVEPTWVDKTKREIKRLSDKVSLVLDIELK